ncbi:hypothetical protein [Candidatus Enterovibrio escicola]|nr:hypothetical protein [Candidatus Enterovibrio escacola]
MTNGIEGSNMHRANPLQGFFTTAQTRSMIGREIEMAEALIEKTAFRFQIAHLKNVTSQH